MEPNSLKGRQLYVANLPYTAGWQDVKDLFRRAGNIQRANVLSSKDGRSKGRAIVMFATPQDAQNAINLLNGYEWQGRRLEVREYRGSSEQSPLSARTGIVTNLEHAGLSTVEAGLSKMKITSENTQNIFPPGGDFDQSLSTGLTPVGQRAFIGHSISPGTMDAVQSRQLFVANLPPRVRWQDLKDLFRKAGNVLRADVALGPDNRSKCHGTVLFVTPDDARSGIELFNGFNWQGRILEVREDHGILNDSVGQIHNSASPRIPLDRSIANGGLLSRSALSLPNTSGGVGLSQIIPDASSQASSTVSSLRGYNLGPRNISSQPSLSGRQLFVANIPFQCQWQDLKDLFRKAGNILRADVATGLDGRSRGFGTVIYATPEDAQKAIEIFDGYEYQGRALRVHYDKFAPTSWVSSSNSPVTGSAAQTSPLGAQTLERNMRPQLMIASEQQFPPLSDPLPLSTGFSSSMTQHSLSMHSLSRITSSFAPPAPMDEDPLTSRPSPVTAAGFPSINSGLLSTPSLGDLAAMQTGSSLLEPTHSSLLPPVGGSAGYSPSSSQFDYGLGPIGPPKQHDLNPTTMMNSPNTLSPYDPPPLSYHHASLSDSALGNGRDLFGLGSDAGSVSGSGAVTSSGGGVALSLTGSQIGSSWSGTPPLPSSAGDANGNGAHPNLNAPPASIMVGYLRGLK
ncbi:uncharacterized protein VTP21DRAFT_4496 [Calcarisporiella thermophila]|uniref:uncharacterized protein n=1 Tax=Calcarisporiella thermophila TaxID=911321 RepID=UPI0037431BF1